MNRALVLGIAIFVAVIGIALVGGESQAVAGHGCNGCDCDCGGCACDCGGRRSRCCGRRQRRNKCCGCSAPANDCCAPAACGCAGGAIEYQEAAPEEAPAAPAAPASFTRVSFVR